MIKDTAPFWKWFRAHEKNYRNIHDHEPDAITSRLDEIVARLKEYSEGLSVELGGKEAPYELIITPQGISEYFADAEYLVMNAPAVKGWTFFALKQPHGVQFDFRMGNMELKAQSIYFRPLTDDKDEDIIGVCMLHEDYQTEDKERQYALITGLYYCLDSILGERAVMLDIDLLEFGTLPSGPVPPDILPVSGLAGYISWRKKERQSYEVRYPENETTLLQGMKEGKPVFLLVNRKYRHYSFTADYPYLLQVIMSFNDPRENGLPSESMDMIYEAEDLVTQVIGTHGHHVVSQTYGGFRTLYCYVDTLENAAIFSGKIEQGVKTHKTGTNLAFDKYWIAIREFM